MWRIRSLTKTDARGRPQYWSQEFGWTWKNMADCYTVEEQALVLLPRDSVWEEAL